MYIIQHLFKYGKPAISYNICFSFRKFTPIIILLKYLINGNQFLFFSNNSQSKSTHCSELALILVAVDGTTQGFPNLNFFTNCFISRWNFIDLSIELFFHPRWRKYVSSSFWCYKQMLRSQQPSANNKPRSAYLLLFRLTQKIARPYNSRHSTENP